MPNGVRQDLTAQQVVRRIGFGDVTRAEVVESALDRVAALNPIVNALSTVDADGARRTAERADRDGRHRGPLDGVPICVKAEFDVAGLPTSHGNHALAQATATHDAPVVARLRAAGAIIIGKGNQPDFAMRWNTFSSQSGWTRNPRDHTRSAGGSSGGDAAAVAAGMVAIGFGTDLAGSIRVPAAFCGVYGLRSTPGRIPYAAEDLDAVRTPAVEAMSAQGPLARSVDDLALAFEVTAGPSDEHPFTAGVRPAGRQPSDRFRVARMVDQVGALVSPQARGQLDDACAALAGAGYDVVEAAFPGADRVPDLWGELLCTELRLRVLPRLRSVMDESCLDHIVTLSQLWPTITDTDTYLARWQEWGRLRRELLVWMRTHPVIVSPVCGAPVPPPLDYDRWADSDALTDIVASMRHSLWPACLGLPAIALPNGVQLAAGPHRDETLFAPARSVERTLPQCVPADLVA